MTDPQCVELLQWALPRLRLRWSGFRKVRRQVRKRIDRRLGELGLVDVSAYRGYLESHPAEWPVLDEFCRITISRFYRDRVVFDYLGEEILPGLARSAARRGDRWVRVWSAGCASGEEIYTVAILADPLRSICPDVRWRLLATDACRQMLERARQGRYPPSSLKDVPAGWLGGALTRSGEEYVVRAEVRRAVEFRRQDIRRQMPDGPWDLVLCRNLAFTYFDEPLQREILRRIVDRTRPGGVLVIGKQESLPGPVEGITPCGRHVGMYRVLEVDAEDVPTGRSW